MPELSDISKAQKRALRELSQAAYEAEMSRELQALERHFQRWHAGEISAFGVDQEVHRYHQGPARKLWSAYSETNVASLLLQVGYALFDGTLSREGVPDDLWPYLDGVIEIYERTYK